MTSAPPSEDFVVVRVPPLAVPGSAFCPTLATGDCFLKESADILVFFVLNLGSAAFLFCLTFLISSAKDPMRGSLASLIVNVLTASIKALR